MKFNDLLIDGYTRISEIVERSLKGLTVEDIKWLPHPESNSIGWLIWHLSRVQDDHIASLMNQEQLWIKDGWYVKFGRENDPRDRGFGHTPEQVAAFEFPAIEVLLEYHRAVAERSKSYIRSLSETDLDVELNEPQYTPLPTVGVRLVSVLSDNLQHAGQAAYVRGMLQGRGWQQF